MSYSLVESTVPLGAAERGGEQCSNVFRARVRVEQRFRLTGKRLPVKSVVAPVERQMEFTRISFFGPELNVQNAACGGVINIRCSAARAVATAFERPHRRPDMRDLPTHRPPPSGGMSAGG